MMPRELYAGEVAGMQVVSTDPILPPEIVRMLTSYAEGKRAERRKRRFTLRVELCTCGSQKMRGLKHVFFVVVDDEEEERSFGPVFTRPYGMAILSALQEEGFITTKRKVEAATSKLHQLILVEEFSYPPVPGMEERFIQEHMLDDAVAELCPPQA